MNWDIYKAWFYQIDGIGKKRKRILFSETELIKEANISLGHSMRLTPQAVYALKDIELKVYINQIYELFHVSVEDASKDVECILAEKKKSNPHGLWEEYQKHGICFVDYSSEDYPNSLRMIPDPPIALYQMGKGLNQLDMPTVAVIGARECTEYGRYVAKQIGEMCAFHGIHVVSGLAYGIDSYAQQSALEHGGEVTAVLGSGVNVCYPKQNYKLYEQLILHGTIYSENKPDTQPLAYHFPPRNRIISGLADAVIVVEAKKKSGTLITVDMALEQGKDVYIVPGRITDPLSYGCNRLIGQGGEVMYDMEKTLLEIKCKYLQKTCRESVQEEQTTIETSAQVCRNPYDNATIEAKIWNSISVMGVSVEDLYLRIGQESMISLQDFLKVLLRMEMEGAIEEKGGIYICKY